MAILPPLPWLAVVLVGANCFCHVPPAKKCQSCHVWFACVVFVPKFSTMMVMHGPKNARKKIRLRTGSATCPPSTLALPWCQKGFGFDALRVRKFVLMLSMVVGFGLGLGKKKALGLLASPCEFLRTAWHSQAKIDASSWLACLFLQSLHNSKILKVRFVH